MPANHLSTVLVSLAVGASAAAVQHGARSSLPPKDTIALIVSISAVVLSILFFFLNRRYTRAVFEATNYPDLKFQTFCGTVYQLRREPVWCWLADTTGQPLWETCVFVRWSNPTKTDAVNVRATITLAQGMRRIRWEEAGDDWRLLKAGSEGSATLFQDFNKAVARLCKSVELQAGKEKSYLVLKSGRPPKMNISVEFIWHAPLWHSREFRSRQGGIITAVPDEKSQTIEKWNGRPLENAIALSLASWRPRTTILRYIDL
jgi:hypothetical protein